MRNRICISELEVFCRIGVPELERATPQRLLVTIDLDLDFTAAAEADDLEQTIHYQAVTERVRAHCQSRDWRLVETLAVEIAELILREFGPEQVGVEIRKFILPQARFVAVRVERTRK